MIVGKCLRLIRTFLSEKIMFRCTKLEMLCGIIKLNLNIYKCRHNTNFLIKGVGEQNGRENNAVGEFQYYLW